MAERDRLNDQPYTCSNRRFETDTKRGHPHGEGKATGSVFTEPLAGEDNGYTLWLEYIIDKKEDRKSFWLMWYDADGSPTIPLSGAMSGNDIREMAGRLSQFIDL